MDMKTTFLNVDPDEGVYMDQPEGFSSNIQICKLKKLNIRIVVNFKPMVD